MEMLTVSVGPNREGKLRVLCVAVVNRCTGGGCLYGQLHTTGSDDRRQVLAELGLGQSEREREREKEVAKLK